MPDGDVSDGWSPLREIPNSPLKLAKELGMTPADMARQAQKWREFPFDLWVYVSYGRNHRHLERAHAARDEIEQTISSLGRWIGAGSEAGGDAGECDVEVAFATEDVLKTAKEIVKSIIKKYHVNARMRVFLMTESKINEMYGM